MRIIRIFDVYESVALLMNPVLHLMEMMIIKELPTDVRKFPGVQKVDDFGDLLRLCIYCSSCSIIIYPCSSYFPAHVFPF